MLQACLHGLQVVAMKTEVDRLKEELAPVYKDKARLTEELMQCRESLTRVRDTNALQDKSLNEATGRIRDLKSRNKELSQQVDAERATQAVAATELEVRAVSDHDTDVVMHVCGVNVLWKVASPSLSTLVFPSAEQMSKRYTTSTGHAVLNVKSC